MKKNYSFIILMFLVIIILCGTTLLQAKKTQLLKNELNLTKIELSSANNFIATTPKQETKIIYKNIGEKQSEYDKLTIKNWIKIDIELQKFMPKCYVGRQGNTLVKNIQVNELEFLKANRENFKKLFDEYGQFKY
jgi:hypothetical protein